MHGIEGVLEGRRRWGGLVLHTVGLALSWRPGPSEKCKAQPGAQIGGSGLLVFGDPVV